MPDARRARRPRPVSIHSGIPGYLLKYRTIETLDRLGLLGPDVHHAHGAQFSDSDLARIVATGGAVTPCPTVDLSTAMGAFPLVGRALEHGLLPALGTDTVAGAGTDLFSEMRLTLAVERGRANAAVLTRGEPPATVTSTAARCCASPPLPALPPGAWRSGSAPCGPESAPT